MFWNTPATASTWCWSRSGTWLKPMLRSVTCDGLTPAWRSTVSTKAVVLPVPSTPIVLPRRSAGVWMPLDPDAMIDASASGAIEATATTGTCCCWARNTSGS